MKTISITLTDAEYKALEWAAKDPTEWVENFTKERCRVAIEEIAKAEIDQLLAAGKTISGSKEDIVLSANIKTAAQREEEYLESLRSKKQ